MFLRLFALIFFLSITYVEAKLPQLTSQDVREKSQQILKTHVLYKNLTPQLAERILQNFLDELDPKKTYLLEPEIHEWLHPSSELLQKVLNGFRRANFTIFSKIHEQIIFAIERRNSLEKEISSGNLAQHTDPEELAKMRSFAKTKEELLDRLMKIKSLQWEIAEKFSEETQEQFQKRQEKHRLLREVELTGKSKEEGNLVILSLVMKAFCSALDAHTDYFTPSEASQFLIQVQQRFSGIGAQLKDNLNGFKIVRILEKSPASKSNLVKINDLIIAVNKEPAIGMTLPEVVEHIQGEKGTPVQLTLLREAKENSKKTEKIEVTITRGDIVLEESRLETSVEPYGDGAIAHFRLFSFYQDEVSSSAKDLKKALSKMKKEYPLKGVILDLRGNAGGLLPQAVEVSGLFLTKGIVLSCKDSNGHIQHMRTFDDTMTWEGPLVVLVDRASASASEIVAQVLQDYGRALIVGDKETFGKGSVQTFTLDTSSPNKINPQGEYKVTRSRYYTVSGKSPQLKGVPSDIVIPGLLSEMEIGEKFAKYPLENDSISPHFEDTLEDLPPIHRNHVRSLYSSHLQKKLTLYTDLLPPLRKNSQKRLEEGKNFQNFLKELKKKNFEAKSVEAFGQNDLQLIEAYNIMKDLVFLLEKPKAAA